MDTSGHGLNFVDFARQLKGRRIAIVYSHRFGVRPDKNWYHRWQTNVIALFSQAAEHCGAIPVFFDIDQWLSFCASSNGEIEFMINLNAGNRALDQWGIAPALGLWRGVPTFPCSAFTVMLGEAKDVAKRLARDCGWTIARTVGEGLGKDCEVVRKPRTYGSSVGLERLALQDVGSFEDEDFIVEEFVPGYDATIVTLYSAASDRLECHGAQAAIPDTGSPTDWVYDAFEKRNPGVRTKVDFIYCPVDAELSERAVHITRVFGGKFVSRVDIRVTSRPSPSVPIKFEDCVFLEINPMPTIGPSNSVTEYAARYVERLSTHEQLAWIPSLTSNRIEQAAIYLLSCGLYVVSSR